MTVIRALTHSLESEMPRKMSMKEVCNVMYASDEDDIGDIAEVQDTDLDRLAKVLGLERLPPYKANPVNPLYVGQIGRYEVWEGRTGYAVWSGDTCHSLGFHSPREAANAAHRLYADDAAEYARYLAVRQVPAVAKRNIKKIARREKSC